MKSPGRFQLKTGDFCDNIAVRADPADRLGQSDADVAADHHFVIACFHHFPEQGRRRCLAIGPGHRDNRGLAQSTGQLHFAPDRDFSP